MEMTDQAYNYHYPPQSGNSYDGDQQQQELRRAQSYLRSLGERKQRLLANLQAYPHQQHEIESQLRQVDREIQQYQQQMGPGMELPSYSVATPHKGSSSYMSPSDSGVQTTAHSDVATGDLETFEGDPQVESGSNTPGYYPSLPEHQARANEQILAGRAPRVQGTMFPESIKEEVPATQMVPNQQTSLQRLAQPGQILKAAILNLANYQGSTEMTSQVLPDIGKLLANPNEVVLHETSRLLHELSKKEASCRAIVANGAVVNALVQALASAANPDVLKVLAGTMHNISNDRQGLIMIYNCSGIPYLVRLLASPVDAVLFYAITTLHNLLMHYEPAKMDVRLAGGLEKMVTLLMKDNPKFLAITADCLHILAYGHQDSKLIILASGGPNLLVRIMRLYTYEKLLWTCSRLLKVLSVCPSNKPEIVQAGGMQALGSHLGHRSTRLVHNILVTLRNLSDAATKQDHLDDLLRHLIMLLGSNDANIVTCSVGVLCNLTCNNPKNKTIVCQLHGVEALVQTINNAGGREEIIESALCALRHITSRHPNAEMAQMAVRQNNGVPLLMSVLQLTNSWKVIKPLIGVFRNVALSHESHALLREQGCIHKLWQLLNRAYQDSSRTSRPGAHPGYIDGVYMEEIMEVSVGALHLLARDHLNRATMKQLNCIPLFVQLLYSRSESITRVAAGVLCELAQDAEGAAMIEKENATVPLTELLHCSNEGVAAYAAAVLFCLSEDGRRPSAAGIPQASFYPNESMGSGPGGYPMPANISYPYSGPPSGPPSRPPSHPNSLPPSLPPSQHHSGYSTPHGTMSGLMTPDLDLPLDLDGLDRLDELPSTDGLHSFPPTTPTTSHHTHHYPPQPQIQHPLHGAPPTVPAHHAHGGGGYGYPQQQRSYNPPSPAIMETGAPFEYDI